MATDARRRVRVWDLPTRAIHWALVALIAFSWWSHKTDHMDWHKLSGFSIAALLVFRLHLGFFGAETSQFSKFLRGPRAAWRYLRGRYEEHAGHNPLGGLSVTAILALLVAQVGLGLFASDEDGLESGPLASMITAEQSRFASHLHALAFDGLLALIALHVVAVIVYLIAGRNLVGPMLTGRKTLPASVGVPAFAPRWSQAIGLALGIATFALLWRLDNS